MGSELWRRQDSPAAPQAVLSARRESLSLTQGQDKVYTFDSEGRPFSFFIAGDFYQRGLGNTLLHKGRSQGQRFRQLLPPEQAESLLLQVWQEAAALGSELPAGEARQVFERILAWTPAKLAAEGRRFDEIYRPISILPPDQYLSLVLQLSEGCSYNRCSFCDFYKSRPFRIKSVQAFREHVQAVKEFLGAGASLRKGIFLADGDALMTPQPRLRECIGILRETYPDLPLYSFMDAFRPQAKSVAEFSELARLGLKRVYLGIETGDAELLHWLDKPGNPQLMQAEATKIKAAGLSLGLIFMVGAGGRPYALTHRLASTAWLRQLPLDREDFVFLSEFIPHRDQPYAAKAQAAGIEPFTPVEMKAEIAAWRKDLQGLSARLVPYHLREFVY